MELIFSRCHLRVLLTVTIILGLMYPIKQSEAANIVDSATVNVALTPSFPKLASIAFILLNDPGYNNSLVTVTPINEAAAVAYELWTAGPVENTTNKTAVGWAYTGGITSSTNPLFKYTFPNLNGTYTRFTIDSSSLIYLGDTSSNQFTASAANFVVTTAYKTQSGIIQYFLNYITSGIGAGTVTLTSSNPNVSCPGNCSTIFNASTPVTLIAKENTDSYFVGFSGGGCSGTANCIVTMDNEKTVTATYGVHPPVKLGANYYSQIGTTLINGTALNSTDYTSAAIGSTININLRAVNNLSGSAVFNRSLNVTLKGGLDGTFSSTIGTTTFQGVMTVAGGSVTVSNLIIM